MGTIPERVLYHHLGLGDHLICNGLVRSLWRPGCSFGLVVKCRNEAAVQFMFRDLPGLQPLPVADDAQARVLIETAARAGAEVIRLGFEQLAGTTLSFGEAFYRAAGLDYAVRFSGFKVERDFRREDETFERLAGGLGDYIFVHDDCERGFRIDEARIGSPLPRVRPVPGGDNIFDYGRLLERAQEIHCIDSAFRNLVDSMAVDATRLVLHGYARLSTDYVHGHARLGIDFGLPSRHAWEILRPSSLMRLVRTAAQARRRLFSRT